MDGNGGIMAKNTSYLLKLDVIILGILYEKDYYGYEMTKVISDKTKGFVTPKIGNLYPILHELLQLKYISSYEVKNGTKIRVYYHIEEKGRMYLKIKGKQYIELFEVIKSIILKED